MRKHFICLIGLLGMVCFYFSCKSIGYQILSDTLTSRRDAAKLIAKVDSSQVLFHKVNENLNVSRNYLFEFAANEERKAQLKSREKDLAKLEKDIERMTIELGGNKVRFPQLRNTGAGRKRSGT